MTETDEVPEYLSERPLEPAAAPAPKKSPFSLFSILKRPSKPTGLTAVGTSGEGVCITHIDSTGGEPVLEVCDYKACFATDEQQDILRALVAAHGLKGAHCSTVLEPGAYSLHLVDAPNVEAGEMRAAIRWRVKELIDYPVEDAAVDIFDVPGRNLRGQGGRMIYVVAARAEEIRKRIDLIEGAGLRLDVIDIPELALRNVAGLLRDDEHGVAMLHLTQHGGLITLTRRRTLYLARSFNVGVDRLQRLRMQGITSEGEHLSAPLKNALDSIVLEIQRSLDYYERHCSNPPISQVVVTSLDDEVPGFLNYISGSMTVDVKPLKLGQPMETFIHLHDTMLRNCLYTIGASLRHE